VTGQSKESGSVTVVRLSKSIDKGKATSGANELKENGKSYYKMKDGSFVYFVSEKLIVEVDREDTMKSILKRDEGKVVISEAMQEVAKKAAKGTTWHAQAGGDIHGFAGVAAGGEFKDLEGVFKNAKGRGGWAKLSSSEVDSGEIIVCADEDGAKKLAEAVEKRIKSEKEKADETISKINFPGVTDEDKKAMRDEINSRSVSRSGNTVEMTRTMKVRDKDNDKGGPMLP
jgi:hypothetical protein